MHFKKIEIENTDPIDHLLIEFPTTDSGSPKPLIIVGENGTGKTILLSHLVNSLVIAKQAAFDDAEVESGKVYKIRTPLYIKAGAHYSYARTEFENGQYTEEWQLDTQKSKFEETYSFSPSKKTWTTIPENVISHIESPLIHNEREAKILFENKCCLYFPINRFEEPAWLNIENLKTRATYSEHKHINRHSNRALISTSPLKENRNWLLDLLFDLKIFETVIHNLQWPPQGTPSIQIPVFGGYKGQSSQTYDAILQLLRMTLCTKGEIHLGVGTRQNRQISISKDGQPWIPNIFQLSTGETQLLNLFLSILHDYDLSGGPLNTLSDIHGIVVIDEIDAHLHTHHQKEVLPELLAAFPNVQFIATSHSPLFLLGMEKKFGTDGFKVINMPSGQGVLASDFSEFTTAYEAFKETNLHRQEIAEALKLNTRPIVFVEGDYDIKYITQASELLGKSHILDLIQIRDGSGFGNLDKIWRSYENQLAEVLPAKILLLYDCDTNKSTSNKGLITKCTIPSITTSPITIGIENLIPQEIIEQLEQSHPQFIDSTEATTTRIRGEQITTQAKKTINKDEKKNLCDWFCSNGTAHDFRNFSSIFDIIENTLLTP